MYSILPHFAAGVKRNNRRLIKAVTGYEFCVRPFWKAFSRESGIKVRPYCDPVIRKMESPTSERAFLTVMQPERELGAEVVALTTSSWNQILSEILKINELRELARVQIPS